MTRAPALLLTAVLLTGAAACAPVTSYNGFQARDEKPADIKPGADTRSTVLAKLGSPSTTSTFEPNQVLVLHQPDRPRRIAFLTTCPRSPARDGDGDHLRASARTIRWRR